MKLDNEQHATITIPAHLDEVRFEWIRLYLDQHNEHVTDMKDYTSFEQARDAWNTLSYEEQIQAGIDFSLLF